MMRFYSIGFYAEKYEHGRIHGVLGTVACLALNPEEAEGIGLREARAMYPPQEGFVGHAVSVADNTQFVLQRISLIQGGQS